jgi:hypothetical protein
MSQTDILLLNVWTVTMFAYFQFLRNDRRRDECLPIVGVRCASHVWLQVAGVPEKGWERLWQKLTHKLSRITYLTFR